MDLSNLRYFKRPRNILLFIRVFFSLFMIKLLMWTVRLPNLLRLVDRREKRPFDKTFIENSALFSDIILHRIFRTSRPCMPRSLLLLRYLRSMGADAKIVFGVKEGEDALKGHAWIIHNDRCLHENGDPAREYDVIYVYP